MSKAKALSEAQNTQVKNLFNEIKSVLSPFLNPLTDDEKKRLLHVGGVSDEFILSAIRAAKLFPGMVPPYCSVEEMETIMEAIKQYKGFLLTLAQLLGDLDDTLFLIRGEAFKEGLAFYEAVKRAKDMNVEGAQAVYDELSKRFEKQGFNKNKNKKKTEKPANQGSENI